MDENQTNQLPRLPFFGALTDEQMEVVSGHLEVLDLEPKQTVFEEGDPGDCVYFIIQGSLEVNMEAGWGENVALATLSNGALFGEMSIIDDLPRSASIVALTKSTVLSLKKADFERILEEYPSIGVVILKGLAAILSQRLRDTSESLFDFL
jgi:CRP-like cAMP-binding protein